MAELNEIIEVLSGLQRLAIAEILAAERVADLPRQSDTGSDRKPSDFSRQHTERKIKPTIRLRRKKRHVDNSR